MGKRLDRISYLLGGLAIRISYLLGGLAMRTLYAALPRWRDDRAQKLVRQRFVARVTDGDRTFLWPPPGYGTGRDETNGAKRWVP